MPNPNRKSLEPDDDAFVCPLPLDAILEAVDTATETVLGIDADDRKGWTPIAVNNYALKTLRKALAGSDWIRYVHPDNFEVVRHLETDTDATIYYGSDEVGTDFPGFYSARKRTASRAACDLAQGELFEDEDLGVPPNETLIRGGTGTYLVILVYVVKTVDGSIERRCQVAVNPRHSNQRITSYDALLDVDLPPWSDEEGNKAPAPDSDGGTGEELDVTGGGSGHVLAGNT